MPVTSSPATAAQMTRAALSDELLGNAGRGMTDTCNAAALNYTPGASCPAFDTVMEAAFPSCDVRHAVQMWLGAALTGKPSATPIAVFSGNALLARDVLFWTLRRILLRQFCEVPVEAVWGGKLEDPTTPAPELMPLQRALLAACIHDRAPGGTPYGLIAALDQKTTVSVRQVYMNPVSFRARFKVAVFSRIAPNFAHIAPNLRPRIFHTPVMPYGNWDVANQAIEELPGITNWLLDGLAAYRAAPRQTCED